MRELELHPLCTLFPRLTGAEFDALRDDISVNGLRQPIVTHDGMILDGGNRYRACLEAGVEPTFIKFSGESIGAFVLSANMHRRHLSAGQQAAIVASVQDWGKAQSVGKPKSVNVDPLATVEQRAAQSGASRSTQKMADKVAKASPELSGRVARGEISLPKAVKQIEPAKPVSKPAKPAKNAPTIESLQAEIEALRIELQDAYANARELGDMVQVQDVVSQGEAAAAKEIKRLMAELNTTRSQRDSYMTKCNELVKSVNHWKRQAGQK